MTSTLPSPVAGDMPAPDVLAAAADLLDLHGLHPAFWRSGVLVREYWPDEQAQRWRPGLPLSPLGAVGVALGLRHRHDVTEWLIPGLLVDGEPAHPAVDALREHLGHGSVDELLDWCDIASGLHAAATMRDCAAYLREDGAAA